MIQPITIRLLLLSFLLVEGEGIVPNILWLADGHTLGYIAALLKSF